uniref:Uncharacterized protein n=1 Tax=Cryptomonas curvata TaxID=233186 RepID=A0A7S0QLI4_9CRYP|eukprot:CAMPEP_0172157046 /NCGR_PEP_ID=MMETSP1050-20130122/3567_1 /TAXON_ID=233186 /ORGANISM="Cryptomonas curvata, Strain CCAP979/52" /LENGTH=122 /DNA_ID=CAMNT_0012826219 /DNA_START=22 /DNA_END=390 /DNA_ORIENTATION=-
MTHWCEANQGSTAVHQICPGIDADGIDRIKRSMSVISGAMRSPEQVTLERLPPPAKFTRNDKRKSSAPQSNQTHTHTQAMNITIQEVYRKHRQYVKRLITEYDIMIADLNSESLWQNYELLF